MTSPLVTEAKQRATGLMVAAGLLLLVFGFSAMLALPTYVSRSNPVWFIGMLIIFGSALALIAVVFRWLGLSAVGEAFGLPAGSIRTLLAVGVMVLFAVFGLQALAPDRGGQRLAEPALGEAVFSGSAADLKVEIARYEAHNVAVVVASADKDGAKLRLYRIEHVTPPETVDLEKQIITALVTLVTSVVSFYFGSRSAEASRDGSGKGGSPSSLPEATAADIKRVDELLESARQRLAALKGEQASPGNEAALAANLSQASADLAAAEASRTQLTALAKDLGTGDHTLEGLNAALGTLKAALEALAKLLSQGETLAAKG